MPIEQHAATTEAHRSIVELCRSGLDSVALRQAVIGELRRVIAFDACCMGTIDPGTLLITSEVSEGIPDHAFSLAAENEYLVEDVYKFSQLARSAQRYGILSQGMHGDLQHSHRYRSVMPTVGATHELRAAFVSHRACWGGVTLFRRPDSPDFSRTEGQFLAQLSAPLAEGFRLAVRQDRSPVVVDQQGPGLIVLGADGVVQAINGAAHAWLDELCESRRRWDDGWLPAPIHEVAMRARLIAQRGESPPLQAHLRVQTRAGRWLIIHGSYLSRPDQRMIQTAIILEMAPASEIIQLLMQAYVFTVREREVVQLVLQGLSSIEMAQTLHVSSHTVQDHLKAIFMKVGVRSRGELVAKMLGDHYLPYVGPR
ncbi:MAG: helix-turn-helix transcriptional regulator [Kouleothrix sp.]|jgi:DNA-binding CsgD family transcriptional regulator|nr:helix-turn-helix transcriptional regulator [Kouleothrix sp.]